ncbi:MAG: hypothetical protein WBC99_06715, partial [Candidatus Omnitrophota bacterium]
LADRAVEYLHEKGKNAVKLEVYAGSVFLSVGRVIGRLSGRMKSGLESKMTLPEGKMGKLAKWARVFCFRIDMFTIGIKRNILKARGILPVCDRYLYDTLINLKYLDAIDETQYKSFLNKIRRPEVPFLLYLDGACAKDREGQHDDMSYYTEKIKLYEELAGRTNLIKTDSSSDREKVWSSVKNVIDSKII